MLLSVRFWPVHSAILKVLLLSRAGPSAASRCKEHTVAGHCAAPWYRGGLPRETLQGVSLLRGLGRARHGRRSVPAEARMAVAPVEIGRPRHPPVAPARRLPD